jgi:hypothetical protein
VSDELYKESILADDIGLGKTGIVILIFAQNSIFTFPKMAFN